MEGWSDKQRDEYRREKMNKERGVRMLQEPGGEELFEMLQTYLDIKDFAQGTRLQDISPAARAAFRAIREGSQGKLGNPPVW